jgi:uncharacterized protein (TIGR03032 family)
MGPVPFPPPQAADTIPIRATTTGAFAPWLSQARGSILLTTYQSNLLAAIGWDGRQVTLLCRQFDRPMGLAVQGRLLALATRAQLLVLANAPPLAPDFRGDEPARYDALYLPRMAYYTGDLDVHDVGAGSDGLWLVNTRFSCLAGPSIEHSFVPRWRPPFVSDLVPEDRCHLNGLALADGRPRFVTALGDTDAANGWRPGRLTGGVVVDVATGQVVLRGLCMPHSPRLHDGWLWLLCSGTGELWRVDPHRFRHEVACTLPGFARGLCFVGRFALVGLGAVREEHRDSGLPVQARHDRLCCGVAVVDTHAGAVVGTMEFTEGCSELYDVQFLPRVGRAMILNPEHPDACHALPGPDFAFWIRPGFVVPPSGGSSGPPPEGGTTNR